MSNKNVIIIVRKTTDWEDTKVKDPRQNSKKRMTQILQDKEHRFHKVATRLQMKIGFEAHDFHTVDVFYHDSCCITFAITKKLTVCKDKQMENLQYHIVEEFVLSLKKCVIHKKEDFLLSELLGDIKRLSIENVLEDALITNNSTLKRKIAEGFLDDISCYNKDKYLIVHRSYMNLCKYAIAICYML